MNPTAGQVVLGLYAVLLAGGGVMGYLKAGSRPSLIAGVASAVVALIALVLSFTLSTPRAGLLLGTGLALVLTAVFLRRFSRTRKVMPSGMLGALSIVVVVLLVLVLRTA